MSFVIEKKEVFFAILGATIILLWFLWLKDFVAPYLIILPPILAMSIYYSGLFIGLILLSSVLNLKGKKKKRGMKFPILISSISFIIGLDVVSPPFLVTKAGELIKSIDYWFVKPDVVFGHTLVGLGVHGLILWILVYLVIPIILMFIIPIILLNPKKIRNIIDGGNIK